MYLRYLRVLILMGFWTVLSIGAASAQSAITGVVKDSSGAVLPGVTVEAASPALIERVKTTTTDAAGSYKIIDLRAGTYSVTFTLPGFSGVKREGMQLEANFTATIDAEMKVGAVEETLTVTGQAPVVDVQRTARRDVLPQDLVDALPVGRNVAFAGNVLPSVTTGKFDVAGNTAMQTNYALLAAGSQSGDTRHLFDGMPVNSLLSTGANVPSYYNEDNFETTVYTIVGGNAESEVGGVQINMIPKTGGNRFSGDVVGIYSNNNFQASNFDDNLKSKGVKAPASLAKLWDFSPSPGGPIVKDRLWYFGSYRNWAYNNYEPNFFDVNGAQGVNDNVLQTWSGRLTGQATPKNKLTVFYERYKKARGHSGAETGLSDPIATTRQIQPNVYNGQVKWTSTPSNKLLVEAGFSTNFFHAYNEMQEEAKPSASNPLGNISRLDLNSQRVTGSPSNGQDFWATAKYVSASATYVTGSHEFKIGEVFRWGRLSTTQYANGDLQEQYRCPATILVAGPGCTPVQVSVRNTPTTAVNDLNGALGFYVQDSWKLKRLTMNPGFRFDTFHGSVPEQTAAAGLFVPVRHFAKIDNLPNWKNASVRFGASYDLFGDSRTAIKGSVGQYMQGEQSSFQAKYNPMVSSSDTRTWSGARDSRGLPTNLGPSQNASFGIRINQNPDPNIDRPFQILYNLGVQRELWSGASISANWYRREYHKMITTENLDVPLSAYSQLSIPDPRGNGQQITIYNINSPFLGKITYLDRTSPSNKRTYTGYDVNVNSRGRNGASVGGGVAIGHFVSVLCDVTDPNQLRFCDQSQYDIPWAPSYKMNGVYPLPYGFRVSGVLQSTVGFSDQSLGLHDVTSVYLVTRSVVPTLVQSTVTGGNAGIGNPSAGVLLDPPGSNYLPRVNTLDLTLARSVKFRQITLIPQLDVFNVFNANTVLSVVTNYGPQLGFPVTTLNGRLARVHLTVRW